MKTTVVQPHKSSLGMDANVAAAAQATPPAPQAPEDPDKPTM